MTEIPSMVRHVALRSYGALRFINAIQGSMEDIEGAIGQEQFGVVVFHARSVVLSCLWVRSLTLEGEIEFDADSVSFDFFAGLSPDVIARGLSIVNDSIQIETGTAAAWFDDLREYVKETEELLGYKAPLPLLRSPAGPLAFVGVARQWSPVLDELGLPTLLPPEWLPSNSKP
jgi:hypothetical protein